MLTRRLFGACAVCAAAGLAASAVDPPAEAAPPEGVARTILRRIDFPGDKYATILVLAEIEAGAMVLRHTHPGVESSYVLEGEGDLAVEGRPDLRLKPGENFQIPPVVPHEIHNGAKPMRLAITYVVEKDKPLATLAPK
jgi:quercetin dioxygenase-like cupin family protein